MSAEGLHSVVKAQGFKIACSGYNCCKSFGKIAGVVLENKVLNVRGVSIRDQDCPKLVLLRRGFNVVHKAAEGDL